MAAAAQAAGAGTVEAMAVRASPPPERSHFVEYDDEDSMRRFSPPLPNYDTKATGDHGGRRGGGESSSGRPSTSRQTGATNTNTRTARE